MQVFRARYDRSSRTADRAGAAGTARGGGRPHHARSVVIALLVAAICGIVQAASALSPDTLTRGIRGGIRVYPGAFWSSTMGVGLGIGYAFSGITGGSSSLLLVAKPSMRRGIYEASYFSRYPYRGRPYFGASVYYEDNGRTRYYGLGPFTSARQRVFVEDRFFEARFTAGQYFRRRHLLIQPVAELTYAVVDSFQDDHENAFARQSLAAQERLLWSEETRPEEVYAAFGVEAGWYFVRRPVRAGSSVQATLVRVGSLTNRDPGFWRASTVLLVDEPLGARRFLARVAFETLLDTHDRIPYYMLPKMGGRLLPGYARDRFRANTTLAANAGLIQPLFGLTGVAGADLVVLVGLGNVYDDLSEQFTPRVSFARDLSREQSAALRPSAAAGFRLFAGERPLEVTVLVGMSPERTSLLTFRLHRDIRFRQGLLRN